MSTISFTDVPTSELVATFNSCQEILGGTPVTKFADRATAEKRTRMALSQITDTSKRPGRFAEAVAPLPGGAKALDELKQAVTSPDVVVTEKPPEAAVIPADANAVVAPAPAPKPVKAKQKAAAKEAIAAGDQSPTPPVGPTLPIASDNPVKDKEMPAIRTKVRPVDLKPKSRVFARKEGSKQSVLVDLLSRPQGATFGELYDALSNPALSGKPWTGVSIRSGLAWDINHVAGYGVVSEEHNGEAFSKMGRTYEARRLGFGTNAYNPDVKLLVYRLTYPRGMDKPVAHTPKPVKPTKEQIAAAKAATTAALKEAEEGKK